MQAILREQTKQYMGKYGTPKRFLARQLGITDTHLIHWLNGDRDLAEHRLEKLKQIISQN